MSATLRKLMVKIRPNEKNQFIALHPLFRSSSEGKLDNSSSVDFRRWANENELSKYTMQMLALEHFDSWSTIKMLQPRMIDILLLSEDEERALLKALGQLHINVRISEADVVSDSGYINDSSLSDSTSDTGERERRLAKKFSKSTPVLTVSGLPVHKDDDDGDPTAATSGVSPTSFSPASRDGLQYNGATDSSMGTIHSLREEELRDVLEYMVLEEVINRETQEEVLSQKSYLSQVQLLRNIIGATGEKTRRNLEDILRNNYNACLPSISESQENRPPDGANVDEDNTVMRTKPPEGAKADEDNTLMRTKRRRVSWAAHTSADQTTRSSTNRRSLDSAIAKSEVFAITVEDNRLQGFTNPFYEDDDGRAELQETPLLKFGHKGREEGELQDAVSVTSIQIGKIIVTDLVNNRLQIFDEFGAPVQTISVPRRFEPWNVVLSPHGWIACTFRNSRALSILTRDGTEISSIGKEIFDSPTGLAIDQCGRYIVTDDRANRVTVHSYDDKYKRFTTHNLNSNISFNQPRYISVTEQGQIIVSESGNHCIKVLTSEGDLDFQFGSYGHTRGCFRCPYGVCSDSSGNILVADHYNNRISMFDARGVFIRNLVTRNHGLIRPKAIHISRDQKLYITHGGMKASELLVFDLTGETTENEFDFTVV